MGLMGTLGIVLWEIATSLSDIIIMEDRNEKNAEKNNVMEFDSTLHISILGFVIWSHNIQGPCDSVMYKSSSLPFSLNY